MSKYIILLIFILILLFVLYIIDNKKDKGKKIIVSSFLLILPIFSLFLVMDNTEAEEVKNNTLPLLKTTKKEIKNISLNKVVIVGDSRMEYIKNKEDELDIPNNFIFDAKGGATISWARELGIPTLNNILDSKDEKYQYHVLFNLGVNDLNTNISIKNRANEYFNLYKNVIKKHANVQFYLLSVNPIDEDIINDNFKNIRTNNKIKQFNYYLKKEMTGSSLDNIKYCDSYNNLEFNLPDGLHYDTKTDQKIIDYIANNCIDYK